MFDEPEEDKLLDKSTFITKCSHEYVDFYSGWGYIDKELTKQIVWLFCKRCSNKKKIYLDMSEVYRDEDEEL